MADAKTRKIMEEAIDAIPKGTRAYLTGGALRNALFYEMFGRKLPHRDYDVVLVGDAKKFIENLRRRGFTYGFIRRKDDVTMKKALRKTGAPRKRALWKPEHFRDYIFLDIHVAEGSIRKSLARGAGFTINGFALPLRYAASDRWHSHVIALSGAWRDLRSRQLRVNALSHPAMLYAAIRFMAIGFKQPSKSDTEAMLVALTKLPRYKFQRNVKKVFDYVGGPRKARRIAKRLGIGKDIFDWRTIEKMRKNPR